MTTSNPNKKDRQGAATIRLKPKAEQYIVQYACKHELSNTSAVNQIINRFFEDEVMTYEEAA